MKTGMTREEKNWVLYDVGNSAFVLLVATIMPIYFNYLAENAGLSAADYLAYLGICHISSNLKLWPFSVRYLELWRIQKD